MKRCTKNDRPTKQAEYVKCVYGLYERFLIVFLEKRDNNNFMLYGKNNWRINDEYCLGLFD